MGAHPTSLIPVHRGVITELWKFLHQVRFLLREPRSALALLQGASSEEPATHQRPGLHAESDVQLVVHFCSRRPLLPGSPVTGSTACFAPPCTVLQFVCSKCRYILPAPAVNLRPENSLGSAAEIQYQEALQHNRKQTHATTGYHFRGWQERKARAPFLRFSPPPDPSVKSLNHILGFTPPANQRAPRLFRVV